MYTLIFSYFKDAPNIWEGWQNMASPIGESLVYFHDIFMWLSLSVFSLITLLVFLVAKPSNFTMRRFNHDYFIEVIWTVLPALVLLLLAIPSFKLLYLMDDFSHPSLSIKIIGHQWYWSYEIFNGEDNISFDSYMIPLEDLSSGLRLLEVDNRLYLPWANSIRAMITSSDVIHSWALPSMGVKVDAIPGRINSIVFIPNRVGVFYGQCSELCGANHAFMPIVIESLPMHHFILKVSSILNEGANNDMFSPLDTFNNLSSPLIKSSLLSLLLGSLLLLPLLKMSIPITTNLFKFIAQTNQNLLSWMPLFGTIILFISLNNLIGLIPYTFSSTAMFSITLSLSASLWTSILLLSLLSQGKNFLSHFLPEGIPLLLSPLLIPIEIISYISRAMSLGIRLSANIISGHLLFLILMGFIGPLQIGGSIIILLIIILSLLEIAVCLIQAYVFITLVSIYASEI